ncbi:MAG: hypothetical protein HGB28_00305 [Oscillochloris sp.]|nr:hypothetical protein [Oscillochloris sp.]
MLSTLAARERHAIDGQWPYVEFRERLLEDEVERRAQKQLALRVRRAALTRTKPLDSFDGTFNPTVNRQWVAYRRSGGQLCKIYLGRSPQVTAHRLAAVAVQFLQATGGVTAPAPTERGCGSHPSQTKTAFATHRPDSCGRRARLCSIADDECALTSDD